MATSAVLVRQALCALKKLVAELDSAPAGLEIGDLGTQLLTVLLRLVFMLLAEARGLAPNRRAVSSKAHSLTNLYGELCARETHSGLVTDSTFAWHRLGHLFREVRWAMNDHRDSQAFAIHSPGTLFDSSRAPLLEREDFALTDTSLKSLLDTLLIGGDEPLDYSRFEVEALGSVYEGLLDYSVCRVVDPSVRFQPSGSVLALTELLRVPKSQRLDWLRWHAGVKLGEPAARRIQAADRVKELAQAFGQRRGCELLPPDRLCLSRNQTRRRRGTHYTSPRLTRDLVARTLAPLLLGTPSPQQLLDFRICDPAMGSGAFLLEVCRQLAEALRAAYSRSGETSPSLSAARRLILEHCICGIDRDPLAVVLARLSLWLVVGSPDCPWSLTERSLLCGDALVGFTPADIRNSCPHPSKQLGGVSDAKTAVAVDRRREVSDLLLARWLSAPNLAERVRQWEKTDREILRLVASGLTEEESNLVSWVRERYAPLHWAIALPEVFGNGRDGFDVVLGNPPWVAYAGRAAQPLDPKLRELYRRTSAAFAKYRTLQGLFVLRAATLLRTGGRLGMLIPTSMSDLGGYGPVRRAHDALCEPEPELPDYGDAAFYGVFQPCMGLISTRRAGTSPRSAPDGPWPLARSDIDPMGQRLLSKLDGQPKLPAHLFGERGYQTHREDAAQIRALSHPQGRFTRPLLTGSEVEPFRARPPRLFCDPEALLGRFRPSSEWQTVRLLIRQTARYPLAAQANGIPFRNSVLAGFCDRHYGESLLLAWLNSSPIRWYHYHKQRDARQGMPQVKITHLRELPAPPRVSPVRTQLTLLGERFGPRNEGVSQAEQAELDALASQALRLAPPEADRILEWAERTRG